MECLIKNPIISDKDMKLPTLKELINRGEIF